jgi:hypothetical protein
MSSDQNVGLPVLAALKVADQAPDFSAQASLAGKEFTFSLPDALKKGPVRTRRGHQSTFCGKYSSRLV